MPYGTLALDEISTSGNLAVAGNLVAAGSLTTSGNITASGNLSVNGNVTVINGRIFSPGTPIQVQYVASTTRTTVNSTSFVEPSTNYRVSITPRFANSMIMLSYFIPANAAGQANTIYTLRAFRIISGTTSYALTSAGVANGSRNPIAGSTYRPLNGYDGNDPMPMMFNAVDFPNTTNTCTYGFEFKRETGGTGTVYFGYSQGDNSDWGFDADILITATEIRQ